MHSCPLAGPTSLRFPPVTALHSLQVSWLDSRYGHLLLCVSCHGALCGTLHMATRRSPLPIVEPVGESLLASLPFLCRSWEPCVSRSDRHRPNGAGGMLRWCAAPSTSFAFSFVGHLPCGTLPSPFPLADHPVQRTLACKQEVVLDMIRQ